jgi:hypothetical protein
LPVLPILIRNSRGCHAVPAAGVDLPWALAAVHRPDSARIPRFPAPHPARLRQSSRESVTSATLRWSVRRDVFTATRGAIELSRFGPGEGVNSGTELAAAVTPRLSGGRCNGAAQGDEESGDDAKVMP